jgi:hypothetical protein
MIARDHHDSCVRKHLHQPRELKKSMEDGGIRRADGVKDVAGDENDVGPQLDHGVDYATQ